MASLNKVILIGNLGADPEMRFTADGKAITTFRLAVNRSYQDGSGKKVDNTEWVSVIAWEKLAEVAAQYLEKGRQAYVEGRLQTRSWEKDGQKHYRTEVVASSILFLGGGNGRGRGEDIAEEDEDELPFE